MGYNKIVFVRNDLSNDIENAPLSVVHRILSYGGDFYFDSHFNLSAYYEEPALPAQALTVFPERHSSDTAIYVLSGNGCREVVSPKTKKIRGVEYYLVPVRRSVNENVAE